MCTFVRVPLHACVPAWVSAPACECVCVYACACVDVRACVCECVWPRACVWMSSPSAERFGFLAIFAAERKSSCLNARKWDYHEASRCVDMHGL